MAAQSVGDGGCERDRRSRVGGYHDFAAGGAALSSQIGFGGFDGGENDTGVFDESASGVCQCRAAGGSVQKSETGFSFEGHKLLGYRRGGVAQGIGGRRDASAMGEFT